MVAQQNTEDAGIHCTHPIIGCDDSLFTLTLNTKLQELEGTLLITRCLTDKNHISSESYSGTGEPQSQAQSSYCLWESDPAAVGWGDKKEECIQRKVVRSSLICLGDLG